MEESTTSPRILFVSTYPPTRCGIATFTESLMDAMHVRGSAASHGVIRLVTEWDVSGSLVPEVVAEAEVAVADWADPLEDWCQDFDLLWIQHEYGIFGPDDGLAVLDLCRQSPIPIATTLHTVLSWPTHGQRAITESLGEAAALVVVMTWQARRRLVERYNIDPRKVHFIPHGARFLPMQRTPPWRRRRPTIVNWGLMGPGKGLETGIRALSLLQHLDPPPRLVIRGATHPNVHRREGNAYRQGLIQLVRELSLDESVELIDAYMTREELGALISLADMALIPYDTSDQATSGVLVDAVGAGLPVVATAFPHSIELLASGAGRIVPQRDPEAMAGAIEELLTDRTALDVAANEALRAGYDLAWPRIAKRYEQLAGQTVAVAGARVRV